MARRVLHFVSKKGGGGCEGGRGGLLVWGHRQCKCRTIPRSPNLSFCCLACYFSPTFPRVTGGGSVTGVRTAPREKATCGSISWLCTRDAATPATSAIIRQRCYRYTETQQKNALAVCLHGVTGVLWDRNCNSNYLPKRNRKRNSFLFRVRFVTGFGSGSNTSENQK